MAGRIRSIKPEIAEDEIALDLSDTAWRLWVTAWVLADDHGNLRGSERYLAAQVWGNTTKDVATPLAELVSKGRLEPYAVKGQRYLHVHAWERHQRITNAGNPRVPTPKEDDGTWNQLLTCDFAESRRDSITPAANVGESRLDLRSPISDHDPDHDQRPAPKGASNARTRGSRVPEDFQPTEKTLAWCHGEGVDGAAHIEEFIDYWRSIAGQKGVKLDWDATFKNRIRQLKEQGRTVEWKPEATPPAEDEGVVRGPPSPEQMAAMQRFLERPS